MAAMTTAEKNAAIKIQVVGMFEMPEGTVQVDDYVYAVPTTVDGEERWAEIAVTAKNNKPTKVSPAYDPYDKAEEWQAEKEFKAKEKAAKEKAKADKIAKSKSKASK